MLLTLSTGLPICVNSIPDLFFVHSIHRSYLGSLYTNYHSNFEDGFIVLNSSFSIGYLFTLPLYAIWLIASLIIISHYADVPNSLNTAEATQNQTVKERKKEQDKKVVDFKAVNVNPAEYFIFTDTFVNHLAEVSRGGTKSATMEVAGRLYPGVIMKVHAQNEYPIMHAEHDKAMLVVKHHVVTSRWSQFTLGHRATTEQMELPRIGTHIYIRYDPTITAQRTYPTP